MVKKTICYNIGLFLLFLSNLCMAADDNLAWMSLLLGASDEDSSNFEGSISATPVSAGMIRLDIDYETDNYRILGIFRSEPGRDPEYLTALQPTFSIYLDRDLSSDIVYTYSLFAYHGNDSIFSIRHQLRL